MIEIKRLIAQLRSAAKLEAYYNSEYNGLYNHAANALEELQAKLELAKAERDAAVSDLETIMAYGGGNLDTCQFCKNSQCYARGGTKLCLPEWRGPQEE